MGGPPRPAPETHRQKRLFASISLQPCISQLPTGVKPARLRTQASPIPLRAMEPACEHGAACVRLSECPNSRMGRSSPHLQGWVMDEPRPVSTCAGIDVSKDRLDVHLLPSDEAFAV